MRAIAKSSVTVDLILTREELGELAKLGAFLGRDVILTVSEEESPDSIARQKAMFESRHDQWLISEIAGLVAIYSVASDRAVDDVLTEARQILDRWGFPLSGKPSDNRPLGAGPTENDSPGE